MVRGKIQPNAKEKVKTIVAVLMSAARELMLPRQLLKLGQKKAAEVIREQRADAMRGIQSCVAWLA